MFKRYGYHGTLRERLRFFINFFLSSSEAGCSKGSEVRVVDVLSAVGRDRL